MRNRLPLTRPAASASQLRVLLCFDLEWDGSQAILSGISEYAAGRWNLVLDGGAVSASRVDSLHPKSWDGIITRHLTPHFAQLCDRLKIPVIDLQDSPHLPNIPKIQPDNLATGELAAKHFLDLGHEYFAFLGSPELWSQDRARGFMSLLKTHGKTPSVLELPAVSNDLLTDSLCSERLSRWLSGLRRPTALFAANDLLALVASNACQRLNISIPSDLAILGVNNDTVRCQLSSPPLSSIALDQHKTGYLAAKQLDTLFSSGSHRSHAEFRVPPLHVVSRGSTKADSAPDASLYRYVHYIRQHACDGLTVDALLKALPASRSSLEKRFRRMVGVSPHAFIRQTQLNRALELLEETNLQVREISKKVGVPHPEYLVVLFSREIGMSPRQYRQSRRPNKGPGLAESPLRLPFVA